MAKFMWERRLKFVPNVDEKITTLVSRPQPVFFPITGSRIRIAGIKRSDSAVSWASTFVFNFYFTRVIQIEN